MIDRLETILRDLRDGADRDALAGRLADVLEHARAAQVQDRILREVARSRNLEFEERVLELSLLKEVADLVAVAAPNSDPMPDVMERLRETLAADCASLLRRQEATGELVELAAAGRAEVGECPEQSLDAKIAAWVIGQGEPLIVPDVRTDSRFLRHEGTVNTASAIAVPVVAGDRTVHGVLVVTSRRAGFFDGTHARVLRIVAAQLATAVAMRDLGERLIELTRNLETDVADRTADAGRKADDLRRRNEMITELYLSLEGVRDQLEGRNDDVVRALDFSDGIVENVNVGIGVIASDGTVLKWNRAMERITGGQLTKEALLNHNVRDIPGSLRDDFGLGVDLTEALTAGRFRTRTSREVQLPEGRTIHVNANLLPVSSLEDGMVHVMVVLEDVTANMALHAQQVKAERLAAITETMVSVNHEVNNPLAVVLGYAQMLLARLADEAAEGAIPSDRFRAKLARIESEALRIQQITAKLAALVEPVVTDYPASGDVRMIDLERSR